MERIRKTTEVLIKRHPEIEQAILFGSLARGDAVPGSDADLLLILRESNFQFLDRCKKYHPGNVGLGVDVFAYTRLELDSMIAADNKFVIHALREGIRIGK